MALEHRVAIQHAACFVAGMEELFKAIGGYVARGIEVGAGLIIALGAIEAFLGSVRVRLKVHSTLREKKDVWTRFAVWLVLALEFELAADILRTAIAPTWHDIGQLAAVATIRTALNYFLERDIKSTMAEERVLGAKS